MVHEAGIEGNREADLSILRPRRMRVITNNLYQRSLAHKVPLFHLPFLSFFGKGPRSKPVAFHFLIIILRFLSTEGGIIYEVGYSPRLVNFR